MLQEAKSIAWHASQVYGFKIANTKAQSLFSCTIYAAWKQILATAEYLKRV